jgi:hypothetical protein
MMRSLRSERRACAAIVILAALASGCQLVEVTPPSLHDIWDPNAYKFVDKRLTPVKLAKYMAEIDEQYSETRTPAKVALSLETSELSVSANNDCEALWRGARACAWLATNVADVSEREKFAAKGVAMGRKAIEYMSTRVEPYYYSALCLGAYAEVKHALGHIPSKKILEEAKYMASMARSMSDAYDFGGPDRFLGKLYVETAGTISHQIGSWEEGIQHLKRAIEIAPTFGENLLFLAQAYADDGDHELARAELDKFFAAPVPPDYTVEHREWVGAATKLLGSPRGGTDVEIPGLESTRVTDARLVPVGGYDELAPVAVTPRSEASSASTVPATDKGMDSRSESPAPSTSAPVPKTRSATPAPTDPWRRRS